MPTRTQTTKSRLTLRARRRTTATGAPFRARRSAERMIARRVDPGDQPAPVDLGAPRSGPAGRLLVIPLEVVVQVEPAHPAPGRGLGGRALREPGAQPARQGGRPP